MSAIVRRGMVERTVILSPAEYLALKPEQLADVVRVRVKPPAVSRNRRDFGSIEVTFCESPREGLGIVNDSRR